MMDLAIKLDSVRKKYRFFTLDNICLELPPVTSRRSRPA